MTAKSRLLDEIAHTKEVARIALGRALEIMGTTMGNVQIIHWDNGATLHIVAHEGFEEEFLTVFKDVTIQHPSVCGRALSLRRTVVVEDVMEDLDFRPYRDVAKRAGVRAVQSTPLLSSSGSLVGVLSTHADRPHRPSGQQLAALKALARSTADAIIAVRANVPINEEGFTIERSDADWCTAHGLDPSELRAGSQTGAITPSRYAER